jgi:hypothetical protein
LSKFNQILKEYVPMLTSGFIVLEHDLYQQTVDLAVGYFLPQAINSGNYTLKSIIGCLGLPCTFALSSFLPAEISPCSRGYVDLL